MSNYVKASIFVTYKARRTCKSDVVETLTPRGLWLTFRQYLLNQYQRHSKLYIFLQSLKHNDQFDIHVSRILFWNLTPNLSMGDALPGGGILPKILSKYFPTCSDFKTTTNSISSKSKLILLPLHSLKSLTYSFFRWRCRKNCIGLLSLYFHMIHHTKQ